MKTEIIKRALDALIQDSGMSSRNRQLANDADEQLAEVERYVMELENDVELLTDENEKVERHVMTLENAIKFEHWKIRSTHRS